MKIWTFKYYRSRHGDSRAPDQTSFEDDFESMKASAADALLDWHGDSSINARQRPHQVDVFDGEQKVLTLRAAPGGAVHTVFSIRQQIV